LILHKDKYIQVTIRQVWLSKSITKVHSDIKCRAVSPQQMKSCT